MGRFQYAKDDDGNDVVVNPPVLPDYENRIAEAQARGDQAEVDRISAQYAEAREDEIKAIEDWENKQDDEDKKDSPSQPVSVNPGTENPTGADVPPPPTNPPGDNGGSSEGGNR